MILPKLTEEYLSNKFGSIKIDKIYLKISECVVLVTIKIGTSGNEYIYYKYLLDEDIFIHYQGYSGLRIEDDYAIYVRKHKLKRILEIEI